MTDPYASDVHRWWHLSEPSAELLTAESNGWLGTPGVVVDLGCGLGTEVHYLAAKGWAAFGLDQSVDATRRAASFSPGPSFVRADVLRAPLRDGAADALLDRGCFHYLAADQRRPYAHEARRLVRPGGRMLLRACLTTAGKRNDITGDVLRDAFHEWTIDSMDQIDLDSDTRKMAALVCRLRRPIGDRQ